MIEPSLDSENNFDPAYSMFRSAPIKRVPILRVFGTTAGGQKACLHIHGIFPYLYVPIPPGDIPGFLYRLASSLDKALNMANSGTGFEQQHSERVSKLLWLLNYSLEKTCSYVFTFLLSNVSIILFLADITTIFKALR